MRSSFRLARSYPSAFSVLASPARPFSTSDRRILRRGAFAAPVQTRAFSQSVGRRFTDENGDYDPRKLDRESDDVDVCIVGGGTCGNFHMEERETLSHDKSP